MIEWLNQTAEVWSQAMLRASLFGIGAAMVVWPACRVWGRLSSPVRCVLWWLVCLKLLLGLAPSIIALPVVSAARPEIVEPVIASAALTHASLPEPVAVVPPAPALTPLTYFLLLWFVGALIWGGAAAIPLIRARRLVRTAAIPVEAWLVQELGKAALAMKLGRRLPAISVVRASIGVLTIGAWRPRILISGEVLERCSREEVRMILAHEIAHLKRRDGWLGLVPQLAQVLFFFHPAAWLACREFDLAREAACDQASIRSLDVLPDLYGALLLKLGASNSSALCAPGVSSHFRLLHRRISMLKLATTDLGRRARLRPIELVCTGALLGAMLVTPVHGQLQTAATIHTTTTTLKSTGKAITIHSNKIHRVGHTGKAVKPAKVPPAPQTLKTIKIFTLKSASASDVAELLRHFYKSSDLATVTADQRANAVIVIAPPTPMQDIADAIQRIDALPRAEAEPSPDLKLEVFHLANAQVQEVVKLLHETYGPSSKTLRISADGRTNSVVVAATDGQISAVRALLQKLDVPVPAVRVLDYVKTRVYALRYAKAGGLVQIVENALRQPGSVMSDSNTNSLIVTTDPSSFPTVDDLLKRLDIPKQ